ncbi:MAG TPA: penicillin-binding protein 2 [Gammaproteobacteria bacterium]|nr:penicillin-binding protein 2 [Gammaproteobacteria bacterium]
MRKRVAIKDHQQEIQLINQRCFAALVIMIILVMLLIARLVWLQLMNHNHFTTLSQKNWLDLVPLEPTRGLIYDRNGVLLAENIPVYSLDIIPNKVTNMPKTLADIARIVPLTDDDIAQFHRELKQHRRFDEVTLKLRLSEEEVARVSENQYRLPGVKINAHLIRHYPFVNSLSHVLGYVARINLDELKEIDATNYSASNYIGKLGIEKYYEDELHGTVGYEQAENDASGQTLRVLNQIKPLPGKNLYLTIDSQLQTEVEKALAGHRGAVVVIQPSTGQILAMVSQPSYDPNLFVAGINNKDFQALQGSPDRPLYNRALRGLYPYGSTIKPFIAIGGLDMGVTTPDYAIFDPGWYKLPTSSRIFHDHKRGGHGTVNLFKAIISSCDTYFFDLAHRLGIQRLDTILEQFGFGQLTGVDMDEELPGVVSSPAWKRKVKGVAWYEGDTLNSGIGQGFMQVTALQLATGVAIIANHGKRFTPHFLLAEQLPGQSLEMASPAEPEPIKLHNPANWNIVINAMDGVITAPGGTGYHFGKAPYSVAAKTGTAQNHSIKNYNSNVDHEDQSKLPEKLRDNSLFIAFAPIDKPKIAIAVIVENDLVAPQIARQILDYYLLGPPLVLKREPQAGIPQGEPAAHVIH